MIKKISITGGIGSGKSTVISLLKKLGYCVWDADHFVSESFKREDVEAQLKSVFGSKIYLSPGVLNREELRFQVFNNPVLKDKLESIIHPVIQTIFENRIQVMESENISCWVFYEASLIFEKKRHHSFDMNILVTADESKRIRRVQKSKGWSKELIEKIMSQQMENKEKKKLADFVIDNSDTKAKLEENVFKMIKFLQRKF